MEGPTPVSALIHAATMVTAGVYLLVRTAPIFEAAKHVQELAAGLGAATLLIAGLIALVQTDIKRVIAYSTMSQIGYMFLGAGLGAYANAMFLLMAHAFFKALLFLAAGIVIHALAGEQDMRRMGGLRRYLPNTYWAFLIGALALAGIPPLSGFFAKDSILASALAAGTYGQILFVVGVLGTFLTGLYAFRMVFLVFGGEPSPFVQEHLHRPDRSEPWLWMGAAVAVLSVLSVIGGWVQIPGVWNPFTQFLAPTVESVVEAERVAGVARQHLRRHARRGRDRRRLGHRSRRARCASRRREECGPSSSTSSTSTSSTTRSSTGRRCCSRSRCATGSSARSSSARSERSAPSRARRATSCARSRRGSSARTRSRSPGA